MSPDALNPFLRVGLDIAAAAAAFFVWRGLPRSPLQPRGGGGVHAAAAVLEGWLTPSPDASAVAIRPCLHVVINQSTCGHAVLEYDIPRWDFSFLRRK